MEFRSSGQSIGQIECKFAYFKQRQIDPKQKQIDSHYEAGHWDDFSCFQSHSEVDGLKHQDFFLFACFNNK